MPDVGRDGSIESRGQQEGYTKARPSSADARDLQPDRTKPQQFLNLAGKKSRIFKIQPIAKFRKFQMRFSKMDQLSRGKRGSKYGLAGKHGKHRSLPEDFQIA